MTTTHQTVHSDIINKTKNLDHNFQQDNVKLNHIISFRLNGCIAKLNASILKDFGDRPEYWKSIGLGLY